LFEGVRKREVGLLNWKPQLHSGPLDAFRIVWNSDSRRAVISGDSGLMKGRADRVEAVGWRWQDAVNRVIAVRFDDFGEEHTRRVTKPAIVATPSCNPPAGGHAIAIAKVLQMCTKSTSAINPRILLEFTDLMLLERNFRIAASDIVLNFGSLQSASYRRRDKGTFRVSCDP